MSRHEQGCWTGETKLPSKLEVKARDGARVRAPSETWGRDSTKIGRIHNNNSHGGQSSVLGAGMDYLLTWRLGAK